MVNDISHAGDSITLDIAGITLRINSGEADIPSILSPIYKLFTVRGSVCTNYQLNLIFHQEKTKAAKNDDPYPEVVFLKDKLILNFLTSQLTFELSYNAGALLTLNQVPFIELEYSLRVLYAYFILIYGGVLVHAAGIARNGIGYIFCGPSGVGKSTVSKLSRNSIILNDDLTAIRPGPDDQWMIFSTPFANPGQKIKNLTVPLRGIYLLNQSNEVLLEELSPGKGLAEFISNVPVISGDIYYSELLLSTCSKLLSMIPFYKLHFQNDPSFWNVIDK